MDCQDCRLLALILYENAVARDDKVILLIEKPLCRFKCVRAYIYDALRNGKIIEFCATGEGSGGDYVERFGKGELCQLCAAGESKVAYRSQGLLLQMKRC